MHNLHNWLRNIVAIVTFVVVFSVLVSYLWKFIGVCGGGGGISCVPSNSWFDADSIWLLLLWFDIFESKRFMIWGLNQSLKQFVIWTWSTNHETLRSWGHFAICYFAHWFFATRFSCNLGNFATYIFAL